MRDESENPIQIRPSQSVPQLKSGSVDARPVPPSAHEIRRLRRETHQQRQRDLGAQLRQHEGGSGGLYLFLSTVVLMFSLWVIGPRLVEEYYYAAASGTARAEYELATEVLESNPLANVSHAYQMVAKKVQPSVVSIRATRPELSLDRAGMLGAPGIGSGVIMSDDGYLMTNAHVVEDARSFLVQLHDRRQYWARLVGMDVDSDLAVLKIDGRNLIAAEWGDSDELDVGSIVWAIGSPYELQQTVTSGIISGKDRPGDPNRRVQALLQTDAAVNPGNSGGPLVDAQGRVIGINTSIFGETFQGISFAVPSATARFVYDQLLESGKVTRGFLGVHPVEVSNYDAKKLQLPDLSGARLRKVEAGSPADRAGMRADDVIRTWNDIPIYDYKTLYRLAETTPPDSLVNVTLYRDGQAMQAKVRLGQARQRQ